MQHYCLRLCFFSNMYSTLEMSSGSFFTSVGICLSTEPLIQHKYNCVPHELKFSSAVFPVPVPQEHGL